MTLFHNLLVCHCLIYPNLNCTFSYSSFPNCQLSECDSCIKI